MSRNETPTGGGIGLFGATFIVLFVLKLTDNFDHSWWVVTAPLWGPLAVAVVIAVVIAIPVGIYKAVTA